MPRRVVVECGAESQGVDTIYTIPFERFIGESVEWSCKACHATMDVDGMTPMGVKVIANMVGEFRVESA